MLFNSLEFGIFLPITLLLYWYLFSGTFKKQNLFLLITSWFFYAWWDWRFLGLLIFAGITSYLSAVSISKNKAIPRARLIWLLFGILTNLGVLLTFKYYDFFVSSFASAFLGGNDSGLLLNLILPVGISFYSFQAIGYCVDVFRNNVPAEKSFLLHLTFISFFPQLLAGPIGRAQNLIPQFKQTRTFDSRLAADGLRQILWGLFKKMVVADNCATVVNSVWGSGIETASASTLIGVAILYSFQIYGDFSGYSDMAIGTAKLFGIRLGDNFLFPYFSRNPQEFWRRWHISLNEWFRDIIYIPLGGSRNGKAKTLRNLFVVFSLSGLWHGANWTFIAWGIFHWLLFIPRTIFKVKQKPSEMVAKSRIFPNFIEIREMVLTFSAITVGWVFFRADTIQDAFSFLKNCFRPSILSVPEFSGTPFIFIGIMLLVEWLQRQGTHGLSRMPALPRTLLWTFYILFIFVIFQNDGMQENFIYFKF